VFVERLLLICDRDRKWTPLVRQLLETSGIRMVQTPFQAPNANAYAERFVRSIKDECLSRMIPLGERHLRRSIVAFIEHYHHERNHQGLSNELIDPVFPSRDYGCVRRHERLGGLLNYYHRAA
jgi:putative transposase